MKPFWRRRSVTMAEAGLDDLSSLAGMDQQQLVVVERHVATAYARGEAVAHAEATKWSNRIRHLAIGVIGIGTAISITASGLGMQAWLSAPGPEVVKVEVPPAPEKGDQWVLHHESLDGQFVWVREPIAGVQCFRLSDKRKDAASYEADLGCVWIGLIVTPPAPEEL